MPDTLRKPLFIVALLLIAITVLAELGSGLVKSFANVKIGLGITYSPLLGGLLLFTVLLMGRSLLLPERFTGKIQGVVTLVVSLLLAILSFVCDSYRDQSQYSQPTSRGAPTRKNRRHHKPMSALPDATTISLPQTNSSDNRPCKVPACAFEFGELSRPSFLERRVPQDESTAITVQCFLNVAKFVVGHTNVEEGSIAIWYV